MSQRLLQWGLLSILLALGVLYLGDYAALRYRVARNGLAAATETVTVLYGTPLKNGQVRIFWDQPQTQTCIRSLFPHFGYPPCWYAKRHATRVITEQSPSHSSPGRGDLGHFSP
jgi:hypothetical protein